jgi:KDO2-lipid IV(A) lauroyltransferase
VTPVPESRHAPEVGALARLLGRFHVTGLFWYQFHHFGARVCPQALKGPLIWIFTVIFFLLLHRIRAAVAANLTVVLGSCGFLERQRRVFRTLHAFAWCLTERYERLAIEVPFHTTVERAELWRETTGDGRGAILVTAHVGNWEVGSMIPADEERRRVHLVREEELDPKAQEFIRNLIRARIGDLYETHFAVNDPRLGILLAEALGRGEIVALQADRPRAGGRAVVVELFGRPFELPIGPMALARAAGVPLLPVFVLRVARRRYRICLRPPIVVAHTDDRRGDLRQAARKLARSIEWAIGEEPYQWFCFRSVWDPSRNGAGSAVKRGQRE